MQICTELSPVCCNNRVGFKEIYLVSSWSHASQANHRPSLTFWPTIRREISVGWEAGV